MEKIKLSDNTVFGIERFASLSHVVHVAKSAAKAQAAAEKFTDENLRHVEFMEGELVNGIYDNLGLISGDEEMQNPNVDGKTVTISLYQK